MTADNVLLAKTPTEGDLRSYVSSCLTNLLQAFGAAREAAIAWGRNYGFDAATMDLLLVVAAVTLALVLVLLIIRGRPRAKVRRPANETAGEAWTLISTAAGTSGGARALNRPDRIGAYLALGVGFAVLLIGGVGGWAATTELEGAVLSSGTIVVDTKVKKVQHPTGGVVAEIHVKDGDTVKVGDLLLRLDETVTRSNLEIVSRQLDELLVREARLNAERDGKDHVSFPTALVGPDAAPQVAVILSSEQKLFESRKVGLGGQKSQLNERLRQLKAEIAGMTAQLTSKDREVSLTQNELDRLRPLEVRKFVPATKMTLTRRDLARLNGEQSQLTASIAQARGRVAETELQLLQLDQDRLTDVMKDLRETQGKTEELIERKIAAEDQLRRVEIRAPQAGTVHQLSVHTIGGVIMAGEPIMLIVPEGDVLVVEARISPTDIDNVHQGQIAFVRLPAFNQRTTPEYFGKITVISADLARDQSQPQAPPYYLARIAFREEELRKLGSLRLVPGMPAEIHIETPRRTALSYLTKPLSDQIALAFRER